MLAIQSIKCNKLVTYSCIKSSLAVLNIVRMGHFRQLSALWFKFVKMGSRYWQSVAKYLQRIEMMPPGEQYSVIFQVFCFEGSNHRESCGWFRVSPLFLLMAPSYHFSSWSKYSLQNGKRTHPAPISPRQHQTFLWGTAMVFHLCLHTPAHSEHTNWLQAAGSDVKLLCQVHRWVT